MAMNGEHLSPKTRELLDRPIEERVAYIQVDSWIPYSQANKILRQLEDLLNHPKCDRMPDLAITAQTNNGKTRLMKHFLSLHQASESQQWNDHGAGFLCAMPRLSRRIAIVQCHLVEALQEIPPKRPWSRKARARLRCVVENRAPHPRAGRS
jgi:hypothetical protein